MCSKAFLNMSENTGLYKNFEVEKLVSLIDWSYFFNQWSVRGRYPEIFSHPTRGEEAKKLYDDAIEMLRYWQVSGQIVINGGYKVFQAYQAGDDIMIRTCDCCMSYVRIPMLRNQTSSFQSLSDFVTPTYDRLTLFALSVSNTVSYDNEYDALMSEILMNRLADAFQTYLTDEIEGKMGAKSLAFSFGYPATPEHSPKKIVFDLLGAEREFGMKLTDGYAMLPLSSCCGLVVSHPEIEYFSVGYIGDDQLRDYCQRSGLTVEQIKAIIPNNVL